MGGGEEKAVIEQLRTRSARPSYGWLVYFDTNVFDPKHGLLDAQEGVLHKAFATGLLRVVFGLDCFESRSSFLNLVQTRTGRKLQSKFNA